MNVQAAKSNRDRAKLLESALSAGRNRPDRLPGLAVIFERLAKALAEELEKLSFLRPRVALVDISTGAFADAHLVTADTLEAVVRADKWKGYVCFSATRDVAMAFVEAAHGYDGTINARNKPERPLTQTEISIVALLFKRLSRALTDAFSANFDVSFELKSVANRDDLILVSQTDAPVITVQLSMEYHDSQGYLSVVIPQNLLDPFRDLLQSIRPSPEIDAGNGGDHDWAKQLADEISRAFVKTTAVLDSSCIGLGEVAAFDVGTVVPLSGNSISRVCLEIDDRPLFWCELGRQNTQLALRIDADYDADEIQVEEV